MALDASGTLSLGDIQTEFGGSNPIGMSEYYGDGDYVPDGSADGDGNAIPESGAIDISDFYDTSNVAYIDASGGSESNSGDYTFNTYTSSGTFNVASTGVGTGNNTVDYLVVAGGDAGGVLHRVRPQSLGSGWQGNQEPNASPGCVFVLARGWRGQTRYRPWSDR